MEYKEIMSNGKPLKIFIGGKEIGHTREHLNLPTIDKDRLKGCRQWSIDVADITPIEYSIEVPNTPTEYEYYMKRHDTYYLRNGGNTIKVYSYADLPLRYGDMVGVNMDMI